MGRGRGPRARHDPRPEPPVRSPRPIRKGGRLGRRWGLDRPMHRTRGGDPGASWGFGRIGRAVAAKARAFGMELVASDPRLAPGPGPSTGSRSRRSRRFLRRSEFHYRPHPADPGDGRHDRGGGARDDEAGFHRRELRPGRHHRRSGAGPRACERSSGRSGARRVARGAAPRRTTPCSISKNVIITPHTAFFSQAFDDRARTPHGRGGGAGAERRDAGESRQPRGAGPGPKRASEREAPLSRFPRPSSPFLAPRGRSARGGRARNPSDRRRPRPPA